MRRGSVLLFAALLAAAPVSLAEEPAGGRDLEVGVRLVMATAGGVPTNDVSGYGVHGRYRLGASERWWLTAALESLSGDMETPYERLGLASSEDLDSTAELTVLRAGLERAYGRGRMRWLLGAGLGLASVDADDLAGPRSDGGSFDIATEAGTEVVLSAWAGVRRPLGRRLSLDAALRADRHLADWTLTDRVSGAKGTIGGYTLLGAHLGLAYRF